MNNPLKYTDPSGWYMDIGRGVNAVFEKYEVSFYTCGIGSPGNYFSGRGSGGDFGLPGRSRNGVGLLGVYYDWKSETYRSNTHGYGEVGWEYAFYHSILPTARKEEQERQLEQLANLHYQPQSNDNGLLACVGDPLGVTKMRWGDLSGDGKLQLIESAFHYRNGNGLPISVDGSQVNLRGLDPNLFSGKKNGEIVSVNLLYSDFFGEGTIYGRLDFQYLGGNKVQILSNNYDFETGAENGHPWFGTNSGFWRNTFTILGNVVNGSGTPYMINFYGPSTLTSYPK